MMQALQLVATGAPLEARSIPTPDPGPDDVLVRIVAAGICHSDAHYRRGGPKLGALPQTLGHEVAGHIERVGRDVAGWKPGERVCAHYLITCGRCARCRRGLEQFCETVQMIGKDRQGGFAEFIVVPGRNLHRVPDGVSLGHAAIMMCSSATAWHALRKARLIPGEHVAVFGVGGLGYSAIQLAQAFGAGKVFAIDVIEEKLVLAEALGAIPIDASVLDPIEQLSEATVGEGVSVSLDLVGRPETISQSIRALGIQGRAVLVGIGNQSFSINPYRDLLGKESELIGCSDHLHSELDPLLALAARGALDLKHAVSRRIPMDAGLINKVLDDLEAGTANLRTVLRPNGDIDP
jgi:2-desacetyl-2-hydroxyethyl bacteriochlorophyllide A dehydrogenase